MLAFDEEVSGYDLKKWADWGIGLFYWSPSASHFYSELRRLEEHGFATSRVHNSDSVRGRRLYKITESGTAAVRKWIEEAPVDPPMLKHGVLLRIAFGHLTNRDRLKEILQEHIRYLDKMRQRAALDARGADLEAAWAYAGITLQWAERYFVAERELALQLMQDIDKADEAVSRARKARGGRLPTPMPGRWREVEKWVQAQAPEQQ